MASLAESTAETSVKTYPKETRKTLITTLGKQAWQQLSWCQRLAQLQLSTTTTTTTTTTSTTPLPPSKGGPSASKTCGDAPRCYLCVDIDDARAKFARCQEFVEARSLAYNLSSPKLAELGGSERARLPDMFANDWEWSQKGSILLDLPPERIVVELNRLKAPLAVENFVALCTGEKGVGKSGKPLHYVNCPFHRIIGGFVAQAGDILTGTGAGGESIYGKKFKDDPAGLKTKLGKRGALAMCNTGKNTNTSQFFFSFGKGTQKLSGKHVVFGEIVEGLDVLDLMEQVAGGSVTDGKPVVDVIVVECGLL